ncbi:MAG: pantoate--beta-alanine ligase [Deltaproteobacteria bacterium]
MRIIGDIRKMQSCCAELKKEGLSVGFVPTMGALHEGHLSLVRRSKKDNDITCVSIFVNPIQFGPAEDFNTYPRPARRDRMLCQKEKVDLLFMPRPDRMYGPGFRTHVEVEALSDVLCGATRQGHFRGVATVVAKLFNIIQPDRAYFGQKDFQQTVVLKRMAADLNFPVEIKVLPTVRETRGLAMSSRNAYLSAQEHSQALAISRALFRARQMARGGVRDAARLIREMKRIIGQDRAVRIEYLKIVDADTLSPVKRAQRGTTAVVAARVGATRLIDNIVF